MKKQVAWLSSLVMMTASLCADQTEIEKPRLDRYSITQDHITLNMRPLSVEKRTKMEEERAKEEKPEDKKMQSGARTKKEGQAGVLFSKPSSINYHYVDTISDDGSCLELEDGSHWKVSASDLYRLFSWRSGDVIEITPNKSWFSSHDYTYTISNKSNHSNVKANLFLGPIAFGPQTHWIVGIDYLTRHVFFENGTSWCISEGDFYLFADWEIDDTIVVGVNDEWLTSYESILINVNMNHYVRAKQF